MKISNSVALFAAFLHHCAFSYKDFSCLNATGWAAVTIAQRLPVRHSSHSRLSVAEEHVFASFGSRATLMMTLT